MRPIMILLISCFLFLIIDAPFAQLSKKDSLLILESQANSNSEKAKFNLLISKEVRDADSIYKYASLSLAYAQKIMDTPRMAEALKSIGTSYHLSSSFENAIRYYDSALMFFNKEKQANDIARTYSNKCGIYVRYGSLDSAIIYNELSKEYAAYCNDNDLIRIYLKRKANIYSLQGKNQESIDVLKELQLFPDIPMKSKIYNLKDIGANFFDMGMMDSALYYYQHTRELDIYQFPKELITLLNNEANVYIFIGDDENSIKCYLEAIQVADSIDYQYGKALIGSNLANLYFNWNKFEDAIAIYKEHILYLKENSVLTNLAINYINVGISYNSLDQADSSLKYLYLAKEICIETDNQALLSTVYHNLGRAQFAKNNDEASIIFYNKALEANKRERIINTQANIYHDMALSLARNNQNTKALEMADSAKNIYQQIKNSKQSIDIDLTISDILAQTGQYQKAYEKLNTYRIRNDSVFSIEKHKQITELETQYKTAQKESQIQKQHAQIAQNKLQINEEKNKALTYGMLFTIATILLLLIFIFLLRNKQKHQMIKTELEQQQLDIEGRLLRSQMNPHFIFNSLNSIQSYITSNDTFHAETYLSKFANLMRSILENSRHPFISLEQDLTALRIYIELEHLRFEGQFKYHIKVDENIDLENTYLPPMLLQPYIENAIVHGLVSNSDRQGRLTINIQQLNNESIKCTIEDNGIGREKAREIKLRSVKPYKSIGLQVTKERMEVLNELNKVNFEEKYIDLKDENNKAIGTRVELIIPFEKD